ncbi:MAG: hypothetical protein JW760_07690 [Spirochaetales bacterium]|nr:hypothetical protein [Spirochaetales bacterium]
MKKFDKIAVFHYHLLPGGVTNVIFLSLRALIHHRENLKELCLVSGGEENIETIAGKLREEIRAAGREIVLKTAVIPEIGYITPEEAETLHRGSIKKRLLTEFGGFLWWVHNYHLGKNPVFTRALIEAVEENPSQAVLFHLHDFPEDGRQDNLAFLRSVAGKDVYPVLPNVRYAVINTRDQTLLSAAGLPAESLFLLNNPVETPKLPDPDPAGVRAGLEKAFAREFPAYRPDRPLWLYPVRTIRRKNALEAALICAAAEANLLLTLPGVSAAELPYSDLVEDLYRQGGIPGLWGFGRRLQEAGVDFTLLARSCDAVLSSSVQEGFGYLYADAVRWGRPLIARDLPILDGIRDIFSNHPAVFYTRFDVPLEKREIETVRNRYLRHRISPEKEKNLPGFLEDLSRGTVDFPCLPVELQARILRRAKSPAFMNALRDLNSDLFRRIDNPAEPADSPDPGIFRRFGGPAFSEAFTKILESYFQPAGIFSGKEPVQDTLIDLFSRSGIRHLLYEFHGNTGKEKSKTHRKEEV